MTVPADVQIPWNLCSPGVATTKRCHAQRGLLLGNLMGVLVHMPHEELNQPSEELNGFNMRAHVLMNLSRMLAHDKEHTLCRESLFVHLHNQEPPTTCRVRFMMIQLTFLPPQSKPQTCCDCKIHGTGCRRSLIPVPSTIPGQSE